MLQLNKAVAIRTLENLVQVGVARRYGTEPTAEQYERINHEFEAIKEYGSEKYFLIIWETLRMLWEAEVPAYCCGSCAGSVICYCLGITHLDPIKHGLKYNDFANPQIFLQIAPCYRKLLTKFLTDKYGSHHVARIAKPGSEEEVYRGSVMLYAGIIENVVPTKVVTDPDTGNETIAIQCSRKEAVKMGFFSIPYNGFYSLEVNNFTIERVRHLHDIDIERIALDDEATFRLFGKGATTAVPYFDSPSMKKNLTNIEPKKFDELVETILMETRWSKAYAANKVLMAFQSAFLKAHYPVEYMTEAFRFFNSRGCKEWTEEILEDCRHNGWQMVAEERNRRKKMNIII